mmetsp:Transcript_19293/g.53551  ORF Transcript_19293/g.53551 Transcript_19293/m.53551 type:complete len:236 (+) Transcript_19293:328-1035(+)
MASSSSAPLLQNSRKRRATDSCRPARASANSPTAPEEKAVLVREGRGRESNSTWTCTFSRILAKFFWICNMLHLQMEVYNRFQIFSTPADFVALKRESDIAAVTPLEQFERDLHCRHNHNHLPRTTSLVRLLGPLCKGCNHALNTAMMEGKFEMIIEYRAVSWKSRCKNLRVIDTSAQRFSNEFSGNRNIEISIFPSINVPNKFSFVSHFRSEITDGKRLPTSRRRKVYQHAANR